MASFLITSSLLILAVTVIRAMFGSKISAMARYMLWILVLIRLILPFSVAKSPLSILNAAQWFSNITNAPSDTYPEVIWIIPEHETIYQETTQKPLPEQAQEQAFPPTAEADRHTTLETNRLPLAQLLLTIWLSGAIIVGAWFLKANLRFRKSLLKCAVVMDTECKLPVYITDHLTSPSLFGLTYPAIYLTSSAAHDKDALRYSIAHELCHFAHKDHIWGLIRVVLLAVYWFHPFVWLAAILSRHDCELACDEAVISHMGEDARKEYGMTLLRMSSRERMSNGLLLGSAATLHSGKHGMHQRITWIAQNHHMHWQTLAALLLVSALLAGCTMTGANTQNEELEPEPIPPTDEITPVQLQNIDEATDVPTPSPEQPAALGELSFIASFQTLSPSSDTDELVQNRIFNMQKAADMLNMLVVRPGETFSFNDAIGPSTQESGWKQSIGVEGPAYVIIPGGGINQVSTTLYNSLLRANIPVTERMAHSIPSTYVAKGLDATVDYSGIDLKFYNDTGEALQIIAYIEEYSDRSMALTIELYGKPLPTGAEYRMRSEFTELEPRTEPLYTDDPTLLEGVEIVEVPARKGYAAKVYRDYYLDGTLIESELLYEDRYRGNASVIRRGTGK